MTLVVFKYPELFGKIIGHTFLGKTKIGWHFEVSES